MATTLFQGAQLQADAYTSPITGIKVTIDCVDNGTQPTWTSLGLDSGLWGQIGYLGGNQGHYLTPFFQVWDLSGGGLLFDGTKDHSKLSIGTHTFEMSEWKGNVWQFSIDGKKIGTYDMHDNDADAPGFSVAGFTGTEFSSDIPSTPLTFIISASARTAHGMWSPMLFGTRRAQSSRQTLIRAPRGTCRTPRFQMATGRRGLICQSFQVELISGI